MIKNLQIFTPLEARLRDELSVMDKLPKTMSNKHRWLIYADLIKYLDWLGLDIHITEKMIQAEYGKVCKKIRTERHAQNAVINRLKKEGYSTHTIKLVMRDDLPDKYCYVNNLYLKYRLQKNLGAGMPLASAIVKCKEEVLRDFDHYTAFKLALPLTQVT